MTESEAEVVECVHHWMLPSPSGPTLVGVCKKCAAVREYPAYDDYEANIKKFPHLLAMKRRIGRLERQHGGYI